MLIQLPNEILIFHPNGRKQLRLLGLALRLEGSRQGVAADRHLGNFAGHHELPEFAVGQLFDLLEGMDQIVDEDHCPDGKKDVPDGKGDFLIHNPELPAL